MAFINIFVQSDCNISVKNNQLTLISGLSSEDFPLSDINSVMIENLKTNLSVYAISKLIENNVAVYFCNQKHLPIGFLMNSSFHSNLRVFQLQTSAKKPLMKQVWRRMIEIKISNQANVLKNVGKNYDYLSNLVLKLKSGDKENAEAVAARFYFQELFGDNFKRRDEANIINACLNYGYSIIRGLIARSATAHGFTTFLGIEHKNKLNNFNLIDDFIEVFRPMVDLFVYENIDFNETKLNPKIKHQLFNLQNYDVKIGGRKYALHYAIEEYVVSFIKVLEESDAEKLLAPVILPLKAHKYE